MLTLSLSLTFSLIYDSLLFHTNLPLHKTGAQIWVLQFTQKGIQIIN